MWANICFTAAAILALLFILMAAFWGKSIVEDFSRGRLAHMILVLVTWPWRFLTYRSGHGRHTTRAVWVVSI
jgi:hypothetical protein